MTASTAARRRRIAATAGGTSSASTSRARTTSTIDRSTRSRRGSPTRCAARRTRTPPGCTRAAGCGPRAPRAGRPSRRCWRSRACSGSCRAAGQHHAAGQPGERPADQQRGRAGAHRPTRRRAGRCAGSGRARCSRNPHTERLQHEAHRHGQQHARTAPRSGTRCRRRGCGRCRVDGSSCALVWSRLGLFGTGRAAGTCG